MLNIRITEIDGKRSVYLHDGEKAFDIVYGGNDDLYFTPLFDPKYLYERDSFEITDEPVTFEIGEIDSDIYPIFRRLYDLITSYSPFDQNEEELSFLGIDKANNEEAQRLIDSYRTYPLVKDGIITWYSDEWPKEEASILKIKKIDNKIILEFYISHPKNTRSRMLKTYSVRISNSGSTYDPFNIRFMELYNQLINLDLTYHQINMFEYLENEKTKKVKKLG